MILLLPLISIVNGPPAFMGGNTISHLPFARAFVLYVLPLNRILTFSFFTAQPQIFILESLCNTMLSLTSRGSFTSATDARDKNNEINNTVNFIIITIYLYL